MVDVSTAADCGDTCILSSLPILGGVYDIGGKAGVYFEVTILKMKGIIAIGMFFDLCRHYHRKACNRDMAVP